MDVRRPWKTPNSHANATFGDLTSTSTLPIDETQASKILTSLHDLFHLPDGRPQVNVSLLRTAIQQVIHNKFLYPSPVLDVDYAALDSLILRTLTRTLTLPPNTPSSYVLNQVDILPSHLVAHERALRFAHTFTHSSMP